MKMNCDFLKRTVLRRRRRKKYEKKKKKKQYLELENSKSFPVAEKMMRATSASHRTESSSAFFKSPRLLLEKVTCLAVTLSIFLILIFSLAISFLSLQKFKRSPSHFHTHKEKRKYAHKIAQDKVGIC
jgi:Fe2+ transport system protein B